MLRSFKSFPKDAICKICGKNDDKECTLVPIDGTGDGEICEAIPVHVDCLAKIRYNEKIGVFYIQGIEEVNSNA